MPQLEVTGMRGQGGVGDELEPSPHANHPGGIAGRMRDMLNGHTAKKTKQQQELQTRKVQMHSLCY